MTVIVSDFASGEWPKKFMTVLSQHPSALESLDNLEAEGMKRHVVISLLGSYSHPESVTSLRAFRKRAGETAKLLTRTETLMTKSANRLESVIEDIYEGLPSSLQSYNEVSTLRSLRAAIGETSRLRQHFRQTSSKKGKSRDEELLVRLCLSVEGVTGRRHWEDLAYLLDAAFSAHGEHEDWDEDRLRKIIKRFQKSNPKVYAGMRAFHVDRYRDKSKPTPVKRSTRNRRVKQSISSAASSMDRYGIGRQDDE